MFVPAVSAQGVDDIQWIGVVVPYVNDNNPNTPEPIETFTNLGAAPDGGYLMQSDLTGKIGKTFCSNKSAPGGTKYIKSSIADAASTALHFSVNNPAFAEMNDFERQNVVWHFTNNIQPITEKEILLVKLVDEWKQSGNSWVENNYYKATDKKCQESKKGCQNYYGMPTAIPTTGPTPVPTDSSTPETTSTPQAPPEQTPESTPRPKKTPTTQPETPGWENKGGFYICPLGCPNAKGSAWDPWNVTVIIRYLLPSDQILPPQEQEKKWVTALPDLKYVEGGPAEPWKNNGIPKVWVQLNKPAGTHLQIAVLDQDGKVIAEPKVIHVIPAPDGTGIHSLHTPDLEFGDISDQLFDEKCNVVCTLPTATPIVASAPVAQPTSGWAPAIVGPQVPAKLVRAGETTEINWLEGPKTAQAPQGRVGLSASQLVLITIGLGLIVLALGWFLRPAKIRVGK